MTRRTQFEAMLEALVNEDQKAARDIFHKIVVDKSRDIYEELLDEELQTERFDYDERDPNYDSVDYGEAYDQYETEFLKDHPECESKEAYAAESGEDVEYISDDEFENHQIDTFTDWFDKKQDHEASFEAFGEDDDEVDLDKPKSSKPNFNKGKEDDTETEFGAEEDDEDLEDRVLDLEDALEELKAEFEALMADEENEPEHQDQDFGSDDDTDDLDSEFGDLDAEDEHNKMMEYVNKVALPKHGDDGVNSRSIVASKNNMGGTSANIVKGGTSTSGGTQGGLVNPTTKDLNAGNVNVPGSSKATKLNAVTKGHGAEKKGAGEQAANKRSIVGSK